MSVPGGVAYAQSPAARWAPVYVLFAFSRRDRRRHGEEGARDVPEQLTVGGERDGVGGTRKDDELAVAVRQQIKKLLNVGDGGGPVIFAAPQEHRGGEL